MEVGNCFQMVLNNLKPNKEQIKNNLLCLTREKVKIHWTFFSQVFLQESLRNFF